jgi:outer membrane protein
MRLLMCLAVAFTLSAVSVFAQPQALTLDQVRSIALERNLSIIQSQANADAGHAGVTAAYGGYLPTLSANSSVTKSQSERAASTQNVVIGSIVLPVTSAASKTTFTNWNAGLNANLTIFDGFNQQARVGQAGARSDALDNTSVRTRQSIVFQVESGYLDVLRNEQLLAVNQENLKRDQRQLERITESNRVGASALADVYRQQSQVAIDELALITAQNNFDKSKSDLVALAGLDLGAEYNFIDPTISSTISLEQIAADSAKYTDFGGIATRALASRPDYRSAQLSLSAAESGVTSARSTYFPSLSAFGGYGLAGDAFKTLKDNKTLNWGLSLRWTLFDGFQTQNMIESAKSNRRIAEITVVQAERDINNQVRKALLDFDAARKQYEVSQKAVRSAQEDRKIAEERYNLGAGTLLDLLVANANLVNAQANLVNAVYNYITSQRNVEYAIGERQ